MTASYLLYFFVQKIISNEPNTRVLLEYFYRHHLYRLSCSREKLSCERVRLKAANIEYNRYTILKFFKSHRSPFSSTVTAITRLIPRTWRNLTIPPTPAYPLHHPWNSVGVSGERANRNSRAINHRCSQGEFRFRPSWEGGRSFKLVLHQISITDADHLAYYARR